MSIIKHLVLAALCAGLTTLAAETQEFSLPDGSFLSMEIEAGGNIQVQAWDQSTLSITYDLGHAKSQGIEVTFEETAKGISVVAESPNSSRNRGLDFKVMVPRITNLDLETTGGELEIEGVQGEIRAKTAGGNVDLKSLQGDLHIKTMGGNVDMADCKVDGSVKTMGGNLNFINIQGLFDAKTMGGNIHYDNKGTLADDRMPTAEDVLEIETMGGNVDVGVAPFGAKLLTMGGNIEIREAAHTLKAKTMGGNIVVGAMDGAVDAETMGGNIRVVVITESTLVEDRSINLDSKGGDLHITLPASFQGDLDAKIDLRRPRKAYEIHTDFPADIRHDGNAITCNGTMNGGGDTIRLRTVNSDIYIHRAP